jgi:hypothetical protein
MSVATICEVDSRQYIFAYLLHSVIASQGTRGRRDCAGPQPVKRRWSVDIAC